MPDLDTRTSEPDLAQEAIQDTAASDIKAALELQVEQVATAVQLTPAELDKKRQRRFLVVQEIYETEKGYVNDLNNLVRNFLDPLNSAYLAAVANAAQRTEASSAAKIVSNTTFGNESGSWITFDQKQAIVRNAAHLLRVQRLHYKILEDAVRTMWGQSGPEAALEPPVCSDPSVSAIAKCFLNMMAKLEAVYIPYCSAHDIAMSTLAQLKRRHPTQMNAVLEESKSKMQSKLEIQDFLIKPVQRVCKYPLLLNELLKGTPGGTPEHQELTEALEKIKLLVATINERKKKAENDAKRDTLFSRLQSGQGPTAQLKFLAQVYGVTLEEDVKLLTQSAQGQEVMAKAGNLQRGAGVFMVDHGSHDLPFAIMPTMNNPQMISETLYVGAFLFPESLILLIPKKSTSYVIAHVIQLKNVLAVQELSHEVPESTQFGKAAFKNAYRITWDMQNGSYYSVDLGGKTDKEKQGWLVELIKLLTDKVNYMEGSQDLDDDNKVKAKKSIDTQSVISQVSQDGQEGLQALSVTNDAKFNDVYTTESLVAGGRGVSKDPSANRMSTIQNAGKSLFRKVSLSNKSDSSGSSQPKRSNSIRQKVFGTSDSTKSTKSLISPEASDDGNSPKATVQGSMGDMSKWFSRTQASNDNLDSNDDGKQSKWAGGIKAKILTVGKFSASNKKSNMALNKNNSGSNSSLASVTSTMTTDTSGKKKSSIFSSLTRSFSKRKSNQNDAVDTEEIKKIDNALNGKLQEPLKPSPPPKKPEGEMQPTPPPATGILRRGAVRARVRTSQSGESNKDHQSSERSPSREALEKKLEDVQDQIQKTSITSEPAYVPSQPVEAVSQVAPVVDHTPRQPLPVVVVNPEEIKPQSPPAMPPKVNRPSLPARTRKSTAVGDGVTKE